MWTEEKLNEYINNKIEENLHLEYKSADALDRIEKKKKEISKDISAFANSDGGVIIYGIKEYDIKDKEHLPEKIDPVNSLEFSKEWLEQIIQSNVAPRIKNLNIIPVRIETNQNGVVYVVEIEKSDTAHQANDKKYYKRFNFMSVPMEDWEIKDIINRNNKTDIIITIEPEKHNPILKSIIDKINNNVTFNLNATNNGNGVVKYIESYLIGSNEIGKYFSETKKYVGEKEFEIPFSNEIERKMRISGDEFVVSTERFAILPKTWKTIGKVAIHSSILKENYKFKVSVSTEDNYTVQIFHTNELL